MTAFLFCYDTFQALKADCSISPPASLDCLIHSMTLSLVNIHATLHPSIQLAPTFSEYFSDDEGESYIISPSEAIFNAVQKLLTILGQMDAKVLGPILSLDRYIRHLDIGHRSRPPVDRTRSPSRRITTNRAEAQQITRILSKNLNRLQSEFKSFVYWTDNVLLASLASSDGTEFFASANEPDDQDFTHLIDGCVDIVQSGWLIIGQLARAEALLTSWRLHQAEICRNLSSPAAGSYSPTRLRRLSSTSRALYQSASPTHRYIQHRPTHRPTHRPSHRRTSVLHAPISRVMTSLKTQPALSTLRVARQLLQWLE